MVSKKIKNSTIGKGTKVNDFVNLYNCTIGKHCMIGAFVEIQQGVVIGNNVKVQSHSFVCEGVTVDDDVFIGHNVVFTNDKYPRSTNADGTMRTSGDWQLQETVVKKSASIGSNATILPGISIGEGAIVGAGSVVVRDVLDFEVVAGDPARVIRTIERNTSPNQKNVILLGKGELAIRVASWFLKNPQYKLSLIVPQIPEPTWTKSLLSWAKVHRVPVIASGDFRGVKESQRFDLGISVFYDKILTAQFIKQCKRILNIHNSPLPKYRGVRPINWALKNKEQMHGVTIHEITPKIDQGPIIAQVTYSIYANLDEVEDVYKRSLSYAWTLFEQTMPLLYVIPPRKQSEDDATYYSLKKIHLLGDRTAITRSKVRSGRG